MKQIFELIPTQHKNAWSLPEAYTMQTKFHQAKIFCSVSILNLHDYFLQLPQSIK